MCMYVCVCAHECRYSWRPEALDPAEVTGSCELPDVGVGN